MLQKEISIRLVIGCSDDGSGVLSNLQTKMAKDTNPSKSVSHNPLNPVFSVNMQTLCVTGRNLHTMKQLVDAVEVDRLEKGFTHGKCRASL